MKLDKYRIEMAVPADMDSSELLERLQQFAIDLANEFAPEDEDGDQEDVDEDEITNEVSVQLTDGVADAILAGLLTK